MPLAAPGRGSAFGQGAGATVLDILVSAMGRLNFGCGWDEKGLTSGNVTLDGATLRAAVQNQRADGHRWSQRTW